MENNRINATVVGLTAMESTHIKPYIHLYHVKKMVKLVIVSVRLAVIENTQIKYCIRPFIKLNPCI